MKVRYKPFKGMIGKTAGFLYFRLEHHNGKTEICPADEWSWWFIRTLTKLGLI